MNDSDLIQAEEAKRNRNWPEADRRRKALEFLKWAAAKQKIPRGSKESCLARQRELLRRTGDARTANG